ncbi:MAG: thiol reductant ABC exporter subunit CydD [Propionibacteriaceae bacterium]|nr:thiol reductant ABC exporter subunit CydD [Propionibacteriaceae bacterium]
MAGPIDPRLLRRARATRGYLVAGVAVGSTTAILTLGQAWLLSHSVADIFATGQLGTLAWAVGGLAVVFGLKAVLAWLNEWLAQRASAAVKSQLRREVMAARIDRPLDAASSSSLVTLVTQGLDGLDGYFSKYLPQLLLAATVPLIIGVAVLSADLTSAIILALTLPLIPVFMALVGWTTEAITKRRWAVQTRLANHFADLIAGLPTLQVFGRARAQARGLLVTETQHRSETMRTLRVSFLSALVLELLATLSVAVIAVTVGFRVVFGDLDLATALFVLILAPEAYLPVRQVGVHYHDAADGLAAVDQAFALIDPPADPPDPTLRPVVHHVGGGGVLLGVHELTHTYPGGAAPALLPVSLEVRAGEIVALTGPSGVGKTTLLNAVMGFIAPTGGGVTGNGEPIGRLPQWRDHLAYVGQAPGLVSGTVADNVRLGFPHATDAAVADALRRAGAPDLPVDQPVGDDAEGVSAGERRRIAVARALLRVTLGRAKLLVLDEPTAGLDADTEAGLLHSLRQLGVAALVVTHRPAVLAEADRVVRLDPAPVAPAEIGTGGRRDASPVPPGADPGSSAGATAIVEAETASSPGSPRTPPEQPVEAPDGSRVAPSLPKESSGSLLKRLFDAVPGARARLALSMLLAFCATAASVALMAVSAWLLSRAAEQPPVLYLEAAAVGVRFFGISRGVFRYVERLVGHDVALRLQSALRLETYSRLARTTLLGRRRGDLLTRVTADVEAIQDLVVRVWIPFASSSVVLLVTSAAIAVFSPGSALVLLATSLVAALLVPWISRTASARADAIALPLRGELADAARELSRTAPDLVAYGAAAARLDAFAAVDERLRRAAARSAWIRGVGTSAQVLAAGAAVIGALVIGGGQVQDGTMAPVMLAVAVLTPLALHEALSTLILSAQTRTRARAALKRVAEVLEAEPVGSGDLASPGAPVLDPGLELRELGAGWPGSPEVVRGLSLSVRAGEKVALVGPSGIGKTTVAATVLGLIPARAGSVAARGRIGYLAQDAHIFTTTIAENVRIGNRDATDDQIAEALARAGLDLDPRRQVGEAGESLSGGEARRVALSRLLVGSYQVLILDEPTEHLDAATASALIDDIWADSSDRPVLVITHDPALVARCDRVVTLS